jgi:CelD/BcsL family acetyltransferase involved in cellulose biosynthesis
VQISLVEDLDALAPRSAEWNALVERSATNTVFQTYEWTRSWWRALRGDAQALVLVAEVAGRLVGIAPLMSTLQRIVGRQRRVVEFIGTDAADYSDFIVDPAAPEAVPRMLEWLKARHERWDLLHLVNIVETSALIEAVPRTFGERYVTDVHRLYDCPTRRLGDLEADRKVTQKRDLRSHHNHLRKQGEVAFSVHATAAAIDPQLEAFFQMHVDRWAGTATPSFFRDARQRRFYRELTASLAPLGWVYFCTVLLDGKPVASHFGFLYAGRIFYIKPAYDPRHRDYSPGMLQIKYVLEHAIAIGAKEMDFTTGEEPFKYRFANHVRASYFARVHRSSLFYGVDRILVNAKALAKRTPAVRHIGQRLRPWIGGTLRRLGL